jgi:hypothetical protein
MYIFKYLYFKDIFTKNYIYFICYNRLNFLDRFFNYHLYLNTIKNLIIKI